MKRFLFALFLFLSFSFSFSQSLPEGFTDVEFSTGWNTLVGIDFDEKGRLYGWEKSGRVYVVENGEKTLLLDITEEVTNFRDHGLMGFVVDPDFYENGYFYLYYALDIHYLKYFGTSEYHPDSTFIDRPSLGRVARFTADPNADFKRTLDGSKKVLIGESISTGIPILYHSHDGGTLLFGDDGSLLVSTGDGASHQSLDRGGDDSYAPQAVAEGIISPEENVGAYRSQQLQSLNGKVLRIDPATGDGLPGNPFYDENAARANASRVYALGLRNPFRMQLQIGTGSHYIEDGKPGRIFIADVGNWEWEEFNVLNQGGTNFGWPFFEAIDTLKTFFNRPKANLFAPNPLYQSGLCDFEHFTFQDVFHEAQQDSSYTFPNPCDPSVSVREHHPVFFHQPPIIGYRNERKLPTRTVAPGFDANGNLMPIDLHLPEAPFVSDTFNGACASAVVVYEGDNFPEKYQNKLFIGDCVKDWIRMGSFDPATGQLDSLEMFQPKAENIICMEVNPADGCLYYVSFGFTVRQICYGGNVPPDVVAQADTSYGPSPLEVRFSSEGTRDLNGDSMTYHWDFGDGNSSNAPHPTHTFSTSEKGPKAFDVVLTVTDSAGLSKSEHLTVSLNNTPPDVNIISFQDGDLYSTTHPTFLPLQAEVSDAEHEEEELIYSWETFLHHNAHFHPEAADHRHVTQTLITPVGCGQEEFYYRIRLTVSDPAGLSSQLEQLIYPYCGPEIISFGPVQGKAEEEFVQLNWNTLHETRIAKLVIERYDEQLGFQATGELSAAGDHLGSLSYSFQDHAPQTGDNRYRIRAVSEDGVYSYADPVSVSWPPPKGIDLYPNPVNSVLYINFKRITGEAKMTLSDLTGRIIYQNTWDESQVGIQRIYLQNLQRGIYFYNLDNGADKLAGKLVKRN